MVELFIQSYLIALPIILGYIVWLLKKSNIKRDANSEGTKILLKIQMLNYHEKYTKRGFISSNRYAEFCEIYQAYHGLGGNGTGDKMKKEVDLLPIRD